MGNRTVIGGVRVSAPCLKIFVFRIEQVEQGALPDIKLLAIGLAYFLARELLLVEETQLPV